VKPDQKRAHPDWP